VPEVIEPGCGRRLSGEVVDSRIRVLAAADAPKEPLFHGGVWVRSIRIQCWLDAEARYAEVTCVAMVCRLSWFRVRNRTFTPSAESEEGP
jgi:hypothetical protein